MILPRGQSPSRLLGDFYTLVAYDLALPDCGSKVGDVDCRHVSAQEPWSTLDSHSKFGFCSAKFFRLPPSFS